MKAISTVIGLLLVTGLFAQESKLHIGLLGSLDWNKSEYSFPRGFVDESLETELPFGNTIGLQLRKDLSNRLSFSVGLAYAQKNFYPQLVLGGAYGAIVINPNDSTMVLYNPYLRAHQFKLVQVPLKIHFQLMKQGKVRPYVNAGLTGSFRFSEQESYKDSFSPLDGTEALNFVATEDDSDVFGFSFDVGLGLRWQLSDQFGLLFEHSASFWEVRKGNTKFKGEDEVLFKDSVLALSRLSLSLGLEFTFR